MRTWYDLNDDERKRAVNKATERILGAVLEGAIHFNDALNQDDLQERIDDAIREANGNRTPWFAGEYVMESVGDTLRGMAQCDAEDSFFPACRERVIYL